MVVDFPAQLHSVSFFPPVKVFKTAKKIMLKHIR